MPKKEEDSIEAYDDGEDTEVFNVTPPPLSMYTDLMKYQEQ